MILFRSANINDRSLLGSRDSEIALLIEDKERISMRMGGQLYQGRAFAHTLRKKLWSIHLGVPLDSDVLLDPIHDDCYLKLWRDRSVGNTLAYFGFFEGLGDNSISQMIGVRKMLQEKQAKSEGKKAAEVDRKRALTFGSMTMVNVNSIGFHNPLFSPPTDPWKIHVYCQCCDTVNVMSDSQMCLECNKIYCMDCMTKFKCHLCQGRGKCPPNRTEGRPKAKEFLASAIQGFCCCYPADYLKDCDLNDQILSKVVGKMVFQ